MMQVYIDDEPAEDLPPAESFQTVEEYIEMVEDELALINRVLYRAELDGEELNADNKKKLCSQVDCLNVEVKTMDAVTVDSIGRLGEYCQGFLAKLPSILKNWSDKTAGEKEKYRQQVIEALELVDDVLSAVKVVLKVPFDELDRLQTQIEELETKLQEVDENELKLLLREQCQEFIEELLEHLQTLVAQLQDRSRQTKNELVETRELMERLSAEIPGLVEQLQSGGAEEQSGLENIEESAKNLARILNVLKRLDKQGIIKKSLAPRQQDELIEYNQQLTEGLSELSQALNEHDIIMICDIFEYEILPYLENLKSIFPSEKS